MNNPILKCAEDTDIFPKKTYRWSTHTFEKMLIIIYHQGNANQNYNKISPHTCQNGSNKKTPDIRSGEDVEKKELLQYWWWECKLVQPLWKTVWRFLKILKTGLPYDPGTALLGIYPNDTNVVIRRGTCTPMFIAAMTTIAKLWKDPRCPSMGKWIKKTWSKYTIEFYASIRKDEYPTIVSTWM